MEKPDPPRPEDLKRLFAAFGPPPPKTFEIALVLGGTVSAGAYTAGALDFLFEALDSWEDARQNPAYAGPDHRVQVKVIAGTSGGGVNAAIAARALNYVFPPMSRTSQPTEKDVPPYGRLTGNPFYDVWCKMLDLDGFLATDDLENGAVNALLNGGPIDRAAKYIEGFSPAGQRTRSYLGDPAANEPLRLILTMTNLHGVPYRTVFDGPDRVLGETFVDHADHVRFAVAYQAEPPLAFVPRPDETVLSFARERYPQGARWGDLSLAARATSAFPLGFPTRVVSRNMLDYNYRLVVLPGDKGGPSDYRPLTPDWDQLMVDGNLPPVSVFPAVDGGATNNEPIGLARTALCGVDARNPRDASSANRCVLLMDPFSGEAGLGVPPGGIVSVALGTVNTLSQQTRYDTADILLAADPNVFSRFLVSANRDNQIGSKALASGGVGAFIGFACPDFARHDYILGRANCQSMLRDRFGVGVDNPVVKDWYEAVVKPAGGKSEHVFPLNGKDLVRLIPLFGDVAVPETTEPWPVGALDPGIYRAAIEKRWKALLAAELPGTWWRPFAGWLGGELTEGKVADFVIGKMQDALKAWKLVAPGA